MRLDVGALGVTAGSLVDGQGEQSGVLVARLVALPGAEVEVLHFQEPARSPVVFCSAQAWLKAVTVIGRRWPRWVSKLARVMTLRAASVLCASTVLPAPFFASE